jgi:hypothetical protein
MTFDSCRLTLYSIEAQSPLSRIPAFRISDQIASIATAREKKSLASAEALKSLTLSDLDGYVARAWTGIRNTISPVPTDATAKLKRDISYRQHRESVVGLDQEHVDLLYADGTDDFRFALETASPVLVSPEALHRVMQAKAEEKAPALLVEVNEMTFVRGKFADLFDALIAEITNH